MNSGLTKSHQSSILTYRSLKQLKQGRCTFIKLHIAVDLLARLNYGQDSIPDADLATIGSDILRAIGGAGADGEPHTMLRLTSSELAKSTSPEVHPHMSTGQSSSEPTSSSVETRLSAAFEGDLEITCLDKRTREHMTTATISLGSEDHGSFLKDRATNTNIVNTSRLVRMLSGKRKKPPAQSEELNMKSTSSKSILSPPPASPTNRITSSNGRCQSLKQSSSVQHNNPITGDGATWRLRTSRFQRSPRFLLRQSGARRCPHSATGEWTGSKSAFDWSDDESAQQVRYRTFQSVSRVFRRRQAAAGLEGGDSGGDDSSKHRHGGHGVEQADRILGRGHVKTSTGPPIPNAKVDEWISKAQHFAERRKEESLEVQMDLYGERGLTGRKSTRSLTGHRSSLLKSFDAPVWNSESGRPLSSLTWYLAMY